MDDDLQRYPRTPHLAGSKLQFGDSAEGQLSIAALISGEQVWEEKIDGSNVAISFSPDAELRLQSRGHYLTGGWREKQYNLFKRWAEAHIEWLFDMLGARYIMYGEWCYAKHTVFYDRLPHYFLEFDILDRWKNCFLGTPERHSLLHSQNDCPIVSVPVIHVGQITSDIEVRRLLQPSLFKSADWHTVMLRVAQTHGIDPVRVEQDTDLSDLSEGHYLKVERHGRVIARYKFVRPDFLQAIVNSGSHWNARPILPNQLAPGVDIFT